MIPVSSACLGLVYRFERDAMSEKNTCVSIYPTHQATEQALGKLQLEVIDLQQVSIVGKGYHGTEHPIGFYNTDGRNRYWGLQGNFWGDLWGLLAGAAFLWVPGFGSLAAAGPIVSLLERGLEGVATGGGFGVLGAALYNAGAPRNAIVQYEKAVKADKFLLIVHGERSDVERACGILHGELQQVTVHTA